MTGRPGFKWPVQKVMRANFYFPLNNTPTHTQRLFDSWHIREMIQLNEWNVWHAEYFGRLILRPKNDCFWFKSESWNFFTTFHCMQMRGDENEVAYERLTRRKNALACHECERNKSLWTTEDRTKCSALWLMAWPLGWFCAFSVCAVCIVDENQRIDFITGSHFSFFLSLLHSILRISFRHWESCMLRWLASSQDYAVRSKRRCRSFQFSISIALSCSHWFRRLATLMLIARVCECVWCIRAEYVR